MELAELGTEERAVENEIREMEDRLAQMKARRAWLKEQIREGINRQEAKLSSYRGALREAESEVKQFLKRPPLYISAVMGDEEGFMALPSNRRTSGMAREWWTKELSQLRTRKQEVEKERSALEDGAKMWQDSIQVVNEFEDDLRKQMTSGESQGSEMLKKQIDKMKEAIEKLQKTADVAEERGWNLLICAVGAELEAFKEGQKILESALEMIEPRTEEHEEHDDDETHTNNSSLLNELNEAQKETESVKSVEREDSEDDGPNLAELLVDKGHEDDTS
ncbi:hypothetical protein G7Y89_g15639 [Cudoniella acicularis]|uniref:Uncharacterized protein n=1 Tax=Cudoniella acicularis TaxID=354080 RepID=A0A8H4QHV6_9HELO|nr:hypothetical protein G7Y89_g15639 [Cudoniella acicularis]